MARAIIRYSVDGERSNRTGNIVDQGLAEAQFDKLGTRTWELTDAPIDHALVAIQDALEVLRNPPGGGTLDHVWVYVDTPD